MSDEGTTCKRLPRGERAYEKIAHRGRWTPNSTWVNDLRFGWNYHHRFDNVDDLTTPLSSYGINTGVTNRLLGGFPTIRVSGFSQLGGDQSLPKNYGPSKDYDVVDHVSFLRGKHAFKFGAETLFLRPYLANLTAGRGGCRRGRSCRFRGCVGASTRDQRLLRFQRALSANERG